MTARWDQAQLVKRPDRAAKQIRLSRRFRSTIPQQRKLRNITLASRARLGAENPARGGPAPMLRTHQGQGSSVHRPPAAVAALALCPLSSRRLAGAASADMMIGSGHRPVSCSGTGLTLSCSCRAAPRGIFRAKPLLGRVALRRRGAGREADGLPRPAYDWGPYDARSSTRVVGARPACCSYRTGRRGAGRTGAAAVTRRRRTRSTRPSFAYAAAKRYSGTFVVP